MSALDLTADANPQTQIGTGGAQLPVPAAQDDFSQYYMPFDPMSGGGLQALMAPAPADATDSTYLSDIAQYKNTLAKDYGDALAKLGYTDPVTGAYIPGSLVSQTKIGEAQDRQLQQQAILQNTQNAQQQGILFSGMRGQMQAQAELPYVQHIAGLENQLPIDMATALADARNAISDYNTGQNVALSNAAARRAQAASLNPVTPPAETPAGSGTTQPTGTVTIPAGPRPGDSAYTATLSPTQQKWTDVNAAYGLPSGGGASQIQTLPYRKVGHSPGVAYMAHGGEVDGPTPAVIGEQGPEAVVPRTGLFPDENAALTHLRQVAASRLGGQGDYNPTINTPHIHWFGPGGAGVAQPGDPNAGGPVRGQLPPQSAAALYAAGHRQGAIQQWMAHHPAALTGHATGIPSWVHAAVAARIAGMQHPSGPIWEGPHPGGVPGDFGMVPEPIPPGLINEGAPPESPTPWAHPIYLGPLGGGAVA